MLKKCGWLLGALALLLPVLAGCSIEKQAPVYSRLTELPSLDRALPRDARYEPLSPVIQDVYDRSIPEDVYSTE
ncbi:hypothetical protein PaeBR_16515 [Paenibacillus sp. BR2-3]|uniref:hypothetical protein n=1 Tax=Paenibacillus sp. BR2-3 TaxID=3048494 RepID=UPI00397759FD